METRSPSRSPPSSLTQISRHEPGWKSVTKKNPRGEESILLGGGDEVNLHHSWILGRNNP